MTDFNRRTYIAELNDIIAGHRSHVSDYAYRLIGELTDRDRDIRLLRRSLRPTRWERLRGWWHRPRRTARNTDLTEADVKGAFAALEAEFHRLDGTDDEPLTDREREFKTIADVTIAEHDRDLALLALAVAHVEAIHDRDTCPDGCGTCRLQDRLVRRLSRVTTSTETGATQ